MELEYPGYNIVGETWINYNVGVAPWQTGSKLSKTDTQLKTVMDFPLMYLLGSVCDEETDDWDHGFARLWDYFSQDGIYADPLHLFTFLSNHDTDRFCPTEEKAQNIDRYRQALAILLFARGIPQLYYGDEIEMEGGKDPDNRRCFPWQNLPQGENSETFRLMQTFLAFRKREPAMIQGTLTIRPEGQGILLCRQLGKTFVELRLGFPGAVPLPGIAARTEIVYERGKSPIEGVAGYFVEKGGIVLTKRTLQA